ncbi:GntR family transcriptional regulator [Agrilactobacillus yilanensis]|uniref:GntR family transcriptional regulator n=1 Tax=Agrilactobacillus yilanensis TaxID=2485997 RepID=A0ABW4J6W1_9LACO|nr:GntR family transcriptional regulator [Agrilactobacillus yilanensis]
MMNFSNNMQHQAYLEISKRIMHSSYAPGDKISESSLEKDLDLGRTPIREALIRLRKDGLIEVIPQSGTYVSKINLDVAVNARFVRESIERKVMVEAASKAKTADIRALQNIVKAQHTAIKSNDYEAFFDLDEAFHRSFYEITDKKMVWDWLQTINVQLNRFRWLRLNLASLNWSKLVNDHNQLLAAVKAHEPEEAERLTINHLHLMLDEEQALVAAFPTYFSDDTTPTL